MIHFSKQNNRNPSQATLRVAGVATLLAIALAATGCNRQERQERLPVLQTPTEKELRDNPDDRDPKDGSPVMLHDVTGECGITFRHTDGSSGRHYIVETVSAGLATFDYDCDGLTDIYFLNGSPLPGTKAADPPPRNALYHNDGQWRFTDVTSEAGVGDTGYGLGVTVGDYDNDGDPDLYLNNFGPNVLYRNNGDGTFTDVTAEAGVGNGDKVGAGACFFDMDADGDLDLYVADYIKFSYDQHILRTKQGYPEYQSPLEFPAEPDTLYRNDGNGRFTDVSESSGVARHAGTGMGMVCADYDRDGDTDVFVLNDVAANFAFRNDGSGVFEEVGLQTGFAYNLHGLPLGSMGLDCADYDNDGWLDLFMTSYQQQLPVLYRNLGNGTFEDVTVPTGAGSGALAHVNWGTGLVDFDNDGHRDLFLACGHLQDHIDRYDDTTAYQARNILLLNTGNGKFTNISEIAGDGMKVQLSSRGTAFDDLDNDGDIDAVVLNSRREPTILRNDVRRPHHWIDVQLRGVTSNKDAVGTQVTVVAGDLVQVDEVHSGRGYQSHWGSRLHFGLGSHQHVDRIEVRWLSGKIDILENIKADECLAITEGQTGD